MTENKKYELTDETKEWRGHTLRRIRALKDFGSVKAGELGGWIESERNLSQDGDCWIYDDAIVCDNAAVCGDATVGKYARVCNTATVYGNAVINGYALVYGHAVVCGRATVRDCAAVGEYATICDNAAICNGATICGRARVYDNAVVCDDTDYAVVQGFGREQRTTTFYRLKDGEIGVSCGCFRGTIKQFRDKVKKTHGDSKYAQEYLMIADLMELHFGEDKT